VARAASLVGGRPSPWVSRVRAETRLTHGGQASLNRRTEAGAVTAAQSVAFASQHVAPEGDPAAPRVLVAVGHTLQDFLLRQLRAGGFHGEATASAEALLAALDDRAVALVLLDVSLPGGSGFEVCRQIRARSDVPVIFLTDQGALADRIRGFDCGADDYVVQPVEFIELERRIHAVLRRARPERQPDALEGPHGLVVRSRAHEAFVDGGRLDLTPKEFAILRLLLEGRGVVLSSDDLSTSIWGYETFGSRNFVEAHISRVRAKLRAAGAGNVIETVRGVGYVVR